MSRRTSPHKDVGSKFLIAKSPYFYNASKEDKLRTYAQETVGVSESAIMARFGNAGKEISKTQGTTAKSLLARRIDGCYEPPKLGRYHTAGVAIRKP